MCKQIKERTASNCCAVTLAAVPLQSQQNISVLIYIQQDATLHGLFYLETVLHVSGGTITHHQERKQLYLQHLVFVTPLLLPAAFVEELELVYVCCGWRAPPTIRSANNCIYSI
jgi:hypothetical protein